MPLTDEKMSHLQSLYAGKHKAFLHQNHPKAYVEMEKAGTLEAYLQRIGEQAASLYETIIDQMTERAAKMTDQADRTSYLNSAPLVASETVHNDIVYAAP